MLLYYYSGFDDIKNFGDELNRYIWDHYLPCVFDDNDKQVFVGIGTLLNERLPKADKVIVMGSGVGYGALPDRSVTNGWEIYCLRGHLSAKKLGVPLNLVASDPAILVNKICNYVFPKKFKYAFMPHWANMGSEWNIVCGNLNYKLLNPLDSVESILKGILESEVVITEAMHGAIVSDALRTPWIPVHSNFGDYLPFKWSDWCSSLNLDYRSKSIGRLWHSEDLNSLPRTKSIIKSVLRCPRSRFVEKRLQSIATSTRPIISTDAELRSAIRKLEYAIEKFKHKYSR